MSDPWYDEETTSALHQRPTNPAYGTGGAGRSGQAPLTSHRPGQRTAGRRLAAILLAVVLVLGGAYALIHYVFRSAGDRPAALPTRSTSASPSPTTSKQSAPAGVAPSSSATAPGLADCRLDQLTITVSDAGKQDAASGHISSALLLRNSGAVACQMHGYPGVALLNGSGAQTAQAVRAPVGFMGGLKAATDPLPTVELRPGEAASALVEGLNHKDNGDACTSPPALLVTPPNETHSTTVPWGDLSGCADIQIHPVVPGDDGRAR